MTKPLHPLLSISAIVLLSLLTSAILFEGLTSSGLLKNQYIEFGGAAAGFFAALYFLSRWHDSIEKRHSAIEELVARNTQLQDTLSKVNLPPDFDVPRYSNLLLTTKIQCSFATLKIGNRSL